MKKRFLGVYDYTVIVTFVSLLCAIFGILQAISGHFFPAIALLAAAGLCDAFDGRIARSKKNRTEDEKSYGIQLDSLCDVISFGLFPALLCYKLALGGPVGIAIVCFYAACAVTRLAFFNVLEGKRQQQEEGAAKGYHGLPVTSISIILPLAYLLRGILPADVFGIFLHVVLTLCGLLFIVDFPMPKLKLKGILVAAALVALCYGAFALLF